MKVSSPAALKLLMDGSQALARVEHNGIRIDEAYLKSALERMGKRVKRLDQKLRSDPLWNKWRQRFGSKTQIGNRQQLGEILIGMGHQPTTLTKVSKKPQINEEFLNSVDEPFVKDYLRMRKTENARSTFLVGLQREVIDGRVHPFFNLNTVETFRSSSNEPNVQNQQERNEELKKIIKRCYIPSPGNVLIEIDYSALEFRIAACFWKDPEMVRYVVEGRDPHRDAACDIFKLPAKEIGKKPRYVAKNQFVFPELYGSYFVQCAKKIWEAFGKHDLKTESGEEIVAVLKRQGITELGDPEGYDHPKGTFIGRVKEAEDKFYRRFSKVAEEKPKWWKAYAGSGGFRMMTGFYVRGVYSRNFLMNAPVQGPAFHCLLWSLSQIVLKELVKRKMKAMVVAEVHDSLLGDVPEEEVQEYIGICKRIMTEEVRKVWDWIICPLDIEVEVGEESWASKVGWVPNDKGIWGPKE